MNLTNFKTDGYPYSAIFNRAAHCFYSWDWKGFSGASQGRVSGNAEICWE